MSSGVSSKSNTWREGRITLTSPCKEPAFPWELEAFQLDGDKNRGQGNHVCPQLPGAQRGTLAEFSPLLSTPSPSLSTSLTLLCYQFFIFLSEPLVTGNKLNSSSSKQTAVDTPDLIPEPELTLDWFPLPNTPKGDSIQLKQCGWRLPLESLLRNLISNLLLTYE